MARYWQSTTFNGFYVEGRHQDKSIAEHLLEALEGTKISEEILGAGFYVWIKKGQDPALRVKDIGDRTLVELISRERPGRAKKTKLHTTEEIVDEAGVDTEAVEVPDEFTPQGTAAEEFFTRVEETLGRRHTLVESTPEEYKTRLDLQLTRWERPKPMAILDGAPVGVSGEAILDAGNGRKGGGLGALVAMVVAVIVLGGVVYVMITQAKDDPYILFQPGTQFGREETALGFIQADTRDFIVINIPARQDTAWGESGESPRFVREESDTTFTTSFIVQGIDELRINKDRGPSVILEPTEREIITTASDLDISTLRWNNAEGWEEWFRTEINRSIVHGKLVRQDDGLWLQSGDNLIQVELWELLTDEELLRLRWAESEELEVVLEIHFVESLRYGSVRTRSSRKLFKSEIRLVIQP